MIDIKQYLNIKSLNLVVAFANTPKYLFRKFTEEQSVFDLSKRLTIQEYSELLPILIEIKINL
jgi:hypothetical protein